MTGRGWGLAGAGDIQLGGSLRWERRWVSVARQRYRYDDERLLMGKGL